jgi:hypothetical protein
MRPKLQRLLWTFALAAMVILGASYITFRGALPVAGPAKIETPRLAALDAPLEAQMRMPGLEVIPPYQVGMSRDEIWRGLSHRTHWLASASRPDKGWGALKNDNYALAQLVAAFEASHPQISVVACDVFEEDQTRYTLFFDWRRVLVGFERTGFVGYLSSDGGRSTIAFIGREPAVYLTCNSWAAGGWGLLAAFSEMRTRSSGKRPQIRRKVTLFRRKVTRSRQNLARFSENRATFSRNLARF